MWYYMNTNHKMFCNIYIHINTSKLSYLSEKLYLVIKINVKEFYLVVKLKKKKRKYLFICLYLHKIYIL